MNFKARVNKWIVNHLDADGDWDVNQSDAYEQGFIDATKFAARNAETIIDNNGRVIVSTQSILEALQ